MGPALAIELTPSQLITSAMVIPIVLLLIPYRINVASRPKSDFKVIQPVES
jgi:hypothetical protein